MNVTEFTKYGYFPKELPPIFTAGAFSDFVGRTPTIEAASRDTSKGLRFNIPKSRSFKRTITIPNPRHQLELTNLLVDNMSTIQGVFSLSTCSYSIPIFGDADERSEKASEGYDRYVRDRAIKSCGSRFALVTDISRFYQTIYTHSIPWALEGKEAAKRSRGKKTFPNEIDLLLRNMQDQQTLGIPTGPDTSRIISELILCDIDQMLLESYPDLEFLRYVDDYTIPCASLGEAKEILNELTRIFNHYELDINESKTEILELPIELDQEGVSLLRNRRIGSSQKEQELGLIAYFNFAFDTYRKYPNKNVLHYAILEKLSLKIYPENWRLFESLILQCTLYEPRVLPLVGRLLFTYKEMGFPLDDDLIRKCLMSDFVTRSKNSAGFENVWAVYIMTQLEIDLGIDISHIEGIEDKVLMTTILYSMQKGFYRGKIPKASWQPFVETDSLYSDSWLFSHECCLRGWVLNKRGKDISAADPFFNQIKQANISFLDLDAKIKPISSRYLKYRQDEDDDDSRFTVSEILYGDGEEDSLFDEPPEPEYDPADYADEGDDEPF